MSSRRCPPPGHFLRCSRRAFSPTFDRLTARTCETGSGNFQLSRFFPFLDRSAVSIVPRHGFLFSCTCIHHDSHIPRPSSSTRPRRTHHDETYLMDGCKCRLWLFRVVIVARLQHKTCGNGATVISTSRIEEMRMRENVRFCFSS
jgi:hypothetical protein